MRFNDLFGIRLTRRHRVAAYCIAVIVFLALLVSGAIALRGKLPAETYVKVGDIGDITYISASQVNGSSPEIDVNKTNEKLILDFYPAVNEICLYVRQEVLDKKPYFLSLRIFCSGSHHFTYRLYVQKASFKDTSDTENTNSRTFTYVNLGKSWILDSTSGTLSLSNLYIHEGFIFERGGNPDEDRIRIVRTDADGFRVKENIISHVEISNFAFVKEKEGRQPDQSILLDYRFFVLASCYILILFVLPLIFLKSKSSSSLLLLFIIGFLLRISIAPLSSHAFDISGWKRAARTFYEDGGITLYTTWSGPPFWYFTIITFYSPYALLKLLGFSDAQIYYQPVLMIENTFLKLPLILSDVLSAFLIYKICQTQNLSNKTSKIVMLAFLLNPFSIFISSVQCMYDSLAVFLALLGFYLCVKKRFYLCSLIWGLGVKWHTLGFIPFLSILAYFQNGKERNSRTHALMKSVLVMCIGFGFFFSFMVLPYMLHGDLSYLQQIIEFRLKIGGGGGQVESLAHFTSAGTILKIFQDVAGIRPIPNFFLLTFLPIYLALIGGFFVFVKKSFARGNDVLRLFNNALIAVLFAYFVTYIQVTSQTVLWIVPHLILAHYLFDQFGWLPIVLTSLIGTTLFADIPYFLVGFGIPGIAVPAFLSKSLRFAFSASILTIALHSIIKQLNPSLYYKIGAVCQNLLSRLRQVPLGVLYASTTLFMFLQALAFYYFELQPSFVPLSLLILSIIIQSVVFFAMRSKTWKKTITKHQS